MKLGKFNIRLVDTGLFGLDGGSVFGVVPRVMWSKAYSEPDSLHRVPLAAGCLLVEWDDRRLMIDTGNGDKWNDKMKDMYNIDMELSNMDNALKPHGLKPSDITDVILTHLHFDHAGGAVRMEGNEAVPTFPNAKYYVQKEHYKWALNPTDKDRASFFTENYLPLADNNVLEFTDGEGELFPGISVIPLFGHTKAMQMVKITDGVNTLLYCTDLMPTTAHIPYPYIIAFDLWPLKTLEEKKKFLPMAFEDKWIIVFEHDAFKKAVRLKEAKKGFEAGEIIAI